MNKRQKDKYAKLHKIVYMEGYGDGFEDAEKILLGSLSVAKQLSKTAKALVELAAATIRKEDEHDDLDKNRPVG